MSKLSIGIVGLPNVGKSTLFKILTKQPVNIANYPFCTIDPNIGVVSVSDERLTKLAEMSRSEKIIPAVVEFYDIAGLVKGASTGAGLGNQFLSHIKEVSVMVMVLRCFSDSEIIHVEQSIDPLRDLEIINTELALKDLETVEKRLEKVSAEARGQKKEAAEEKEILEKTRERLNQNKFIGEYANELAVKNLNLLSAKKQIYLLNGQEEDVDQILKDKIEQLGGTYIISDLNEVINNEIINNESQSSILSLIRVAYDVLGLISFFTTGEKETRAWTVERGLKTPQAAGVIHTDFEKKFIKAEVINWERLLEAGSWTQAKSKGWLRLEGKEYLVQDGDVMIFKHG